VSPTARSTTMMEDRFCIMVSLLTHIIRKRANIRPAKALYMYRAAIPEELSFAKGDILAVLRLQDDGWWEAEVTGKRGRPGLVPSNYLLPC